MALQPVNMLSLARRVDISADSGVIFTVHHYDSEHTMDHDSKPQT